MHRIIVFFIGILGFSHAEPLPLEEQESVAEQAEEETFSPLFNRIDLTGWNTTGNWKIDGDLLSLNPKEGEIGWKRFSDYLTTIKKYGNFILELEFKLEKDGNSGILFLVDDPMDPVKGYELQLLDTYGKTDLTHHDCGGIVKITAPSKNMVKPAGQWNKISLLCYEKTIKVKLNETLVIDLNVMGQEKKVRPMLGHISLQDHGDPVSFKNVQLKEIESATDSSF